jgi:hypothetical protein
LNLYQYGGCDPVNAIDPDGREWNKPWTWSGQSWGVAGVCAFGAVGAAAGIAQAIGPALIAGSAVPPLAIGTSIALGVAAIGGCISSIIWRNAKE